MIQRIIESSIRHWLFKKKAIVLTGARRVGKSTLVNRLLEKSKLSSITFNGDESVHRALFQNYSAKSIKQIIGKNKLVLIDEVQRIENPGLLLKVMVDNFKDVQFIATGSSSLDISEKIFEPLTGRHILFHLYPFSLGELYPEKSEFQIQQELPFHLVYGSYPEICLDKENAEIFLKNLASQYLYKDVLAWKDIRKPELLEKLLQLLAHQVASEVSLNELAGQLKIKVETVENYIDLLEKSFVIYRLRAYSTNERKEVSKMRKILFWDNGIRNAIIGDFRPIEQRNDVGALWENFMITERMKMNQFLQRDVKSFFWRSLQQQEVDYVELNKSKLYGFEMKWSTKKRNAVTKAFTNLYPKAKALTITPDNFSEFSLI